MISSTNEDCFMETCIRGPTFKHTYYYNIKLISKSHLLKRLLPSTFLVLFTVADDREFSFNASPSKQTESLWSKLLPKCHNNNRCTGDEGPPSPIIKPPTDSSPLEDDGYHNKCPDMTPAKLKSTSLTDIQLNAKVATS